MNYIMEVLHVVRFAKRYWPSLRDLTQVRSEFPLDFGTTNIGIFYENEGIVLRNNYNNYRHPKSQGIFIQDENPRTVWTTPPSLLNVIDSYVQDFHARNGPTLRIRYDPDLSTFILENRKE